MIILLTNDDGITSEGLRLLAERLRENHSVWIAAPDSERSAASHSITINRNVVFSEERKQEYACSGTPADCVLFALNGALPVRPDLVISGINRGNNIGVDTIYSGTIAAARQAILNGIPAIAVSAGDVSVYNSTASFPFAEAAGFVAENLEDLVSACSSQALISINVPENPNGTWKPARLSRLGYVNIVTEQSRKEEESVYSLGGSPARDRDAHPETDFHKLKMDVITVTPIHVYPVCEEESYSILDELSRRNSGCPNEG